MYYICHEKKTFYLKSLAGVFKKQQSQSANEKQKRRRDNSLLGPTFQLTHSQTQKRQRYRPQCQAAILCARQTSQQANRHQ